MRMKSKIISQWRRLSQKLYWFIKNFLVLISKNLMACKPGTKMSRYMKSKTKNLRLFWVTSTSIFTQETVSTTMLVSHHWLKELIGVKESCQLLQPCCAISISQLRRSRALSLIKALKRFSMNLVTWCITCAHNPTSQDFQEHQLREISLRCLLKC